jgi:hypothetical protein
MWVHGLGRANVARGVCRRSSTPKDTWRLDEKDPAQFFRTTPLPNRLEVQTEDQGDVASGGPRRTSARARRWPSRSIH